MVKFLFVVALLVPWAHLVYWASHTEPGPQTAESLNHELGEITLIYLLANLFWGQLIALRWLPRRALRWTPLRRQLGVVTFVYATFHFLSYFAREGDFQEAGAQIFTTTYLILGFVAWVFLLLMALTSNDFSVRRLGPRWKLLHRSSYLVFGLVVLHYSLIEKRDHRELLPFVVVVGALYLVRIARFARSKASSLQLNSPSN